MQVSFPALQSINDNVSMLFNQQLYTAPSIYKMLAMTVPSTGRANVYPRLDMLRGVREWIGSRLVNSLSQETFTIVNKKFEETFGISKDDFEDDQFGLLSTAAIQLGQDAATLPDRLVASLMLNGTTTVWVDGQDFFSTAHPSFPNTNLPGTNTNYQPGAGPSWFLIDNSREIKPFIFQPRVPFDTVARFNPEDPSVFDNDEFLWGTRGRCNAGYGLYQLAFRSDAPLNLANLLAARAAMGQWKRPDGSPMGITPTILVTGQALFPTARAYETKDFDPQQAPGLVPNTFQGLAKAVENRWIP